MAMVVGAAPVIAAPTAAKGNKCVSITLIVFGALGIIFGLVAIIYAASGLGLALEGSGVEALQEECKNTFSNENSNGYDIKNSGECPGTTFESNGYYASPPDDFEDLTTGGYGGEYLMCGLTQKTSGCSYEDYESGFQGATSGGLGATVAGSFFVIIASIPVLTNGVYGFLNMETAARVSGGFGVGCSIPGVLGASICTLVLLIGAALAHIVAAVMDEIARKKNTVDGPCTPECEKAIDATAELGDHLIGYYTGLTYLMLIMSLLSLIMSILACVSCCSWKKPVQVVVVQTVAPVVAAPIVAAPVVAAPVVAAPAVVKTE